MATITVDIKALTGSFVTDIRRVERETKTTFAGIERVAKGVGLAFAAGGAAVAAGLTAMTKAGIDFADTLNDMSKRTGIATEELGALHVMAKLSATNLGTLQTAVGKLAKQQADAARGGKEQIAIFEALGVAYQDSSGKLRQSTDVLADVADVFQKLPDGAEKTALALKLLGRNGAELIPMLSEGSAGFREMEKLAKDLGLAISGDTARAAGEFNDRLDLLQLAVEGLGTQLAAELLPQLLEVTEGFVDLVKDGGTAREIVETVSDAIDRMGLEFNTAALFVDDLLQKLTAVGKWWHENSALSQMAQWLATSHLAARAEWGSTTQAGGSPDLSRLGAPLDPSQRRQNLMGLLSPDQMQRAQDQAVESSAALAAAYNEEAEAIAKAEEKVRAYLKAQTDARAAEKAQREALRATEQAARAYANMMERAAEEERSFIADMKATAQAVADRFAAQEKELRDEIMLLGLEGEARQRAIDFIDAENMARDASGKVIADQRDAYVKLFAEMRKAQEVESILSRFDDNGFDAIIEDIERLGEALERALDVGPPTDEMQRHIDRLQRGIEGLKDETIAFATDAIGQGISSLKSMAEEGTKAYKALEVAQAANNLAAAIGAIVNQGLGDPYTAFARMAAMAAAVSQLVGSIGGTGFSDTAGRRQASQGTGTVLGDFDAKSESIANAIETTAEATTQLVGISTGMLRALQAMQASIGGASNQLARGVGDVEFSALPTPINFAQHSVGANIFGFSLAQSLLGGSSRVTDQGILILGGVLGDMLENISIGAFQEVQSRSWRFGSRRTREEFRELEDEVAEQFQLVLDSMADAVREGAEALGLDMQQINAAIEAFRIEEIRISTMDLSAEEAQAQLEAVFSAIFDDLAGAVVPFIDQFQQVGEGLGETLIRVATSVQVTQEAITQLGLALGSLDPETMAQVSVGLVEAAGGIEDFIQGMQSFVANFAPEAHRFEVAQDALTRAFAEVGLALPGTRDGLWQLMQSLDATTEAGREQIATLLRLAGVADTYYDQLEDNAETTAQAAQAQREALASYAEFIDQFGGELRQGSAFQRAMQDVRQELAANVETANALARAAGLAGAREEDLVGILQRAQRQIEEMIAGLTQTVVEQIASLYGTSVEQIEARIAAIDTEIAGLVRDDSTFGMVMNLAREAELGAERARLAQEAEAANAAMEALARQTQALDLAQNLADLTLARGIRFEDLASELGLNLDRFGADLGITGDAVADFIRSLEAESLTGTDYFDGVQRIVDAIERNDDGLKPIRVDEKLVEGKALAVTDIQPDRDDRLDAVIEELRLHRVELAALREIERNTGANTVATDGVARALRGRTLEEQRNTPPSVRTIPKRR